MLITVRIDSSPPLFVPYEKSFGIFLKMSNFRTRSPMVIIFIINYIRTHEENQF